MCASSSVASGPQPKPTTKYFRQLGAKKNGQAHCGACPLKGDCEFFSYLIANFNITTVRDDDFHRVVTAGPGISADLAAKDP